MARVGNQVRFTHVNRMNACRVCSSKSLSELFRLTKAITNAQQTVQPVQQPMPSNVETLTPESPNVDAPTPVQADN